MLLGSGRTSKLVPHMLPVDCGFVVVFPLMADFGDSLLEFLSVLVS